ncbi:hypothetical protein FJZ36_14990 [Candidatus Poribacteria bacterium]|nr:hypothetical protein [Candidatus Poribacteria bacterium]
MRRRLVWCAVSATFLTISLAATAATAKKDGANWLIETDMYTVKWKTNAQAGYDGAWAKGNAKSIIGEGQGRTLYHSANYAGWKDWGICTSVKELEKAPGKVALEYTIDDGASKKWIVTATYWDGVPYFRHEVVVEAKDAVVSFSDGHEPMLEPRNALKNEFLDWKDPFPHGVVGNENGYFAMYTEKGTVELFAGWAPDGRFHLVHNALGKALKKGEKSEPLVYYMAVGSGKAKDAHDIAGDVTKEPKGGLAVSSLGKLATSWGEIKTQ